MQKMAPALFFLPPMECREVKTMANLPRGEDWQYEVKFDGYRCIAIKQKNEVELFSRRGLTFDQFLNLHQVLREQRPKSFIVDGEIVALDQDGRSDFNALQNAKTRKRPLHFYAFDLLHLNGENLLESPLEERQRQLQAEFNAGSFLHLPGPLEAELELLISRIEQFGFEGIVAKKRNSIYVPGKTSGSWVKMKLKQSDEFII